MWKDHATGERGDAIDFLAKWRGIDRKQAIPIFIEMALGKGAIAHNRPVPPRKVSGGNRPLPDPTTDFVGIPEKRKDCYKGELTIPTDGQREAVCKHRGYTDKGALLCVRRGVLRATNSGGNDYYVITDDSRISADHRPLNGKKFKEGGKSKSLRGWRRDWPFGINPGFQPGERGEIG